jgi:hypothetical protein
MAQNDRFGNPQVVVGLKDKKGTGYGKGFIEIKGDLFKITTSRSNKDGVTEWVTLTKMPKQRNQGTFGYKAPMIGPQQRGF